jgi:hypothetical protein
VTPDGTGILGDPVTVDPPLRLDHPVPSQRLALQIACRTLGRWGMDLHRRSMSPANSTTAGTVIQPT